MNACDAAAESSAEIPGASRRLRPGEWFTLATLSLVTFMVALDVTVVVIALPRIQHDLSMELSSLQWVVTAYSLLFASLLMACGAAADRFGRRKTLLWGVGLFTVASVACGFASSATHLIAARALQGVGAAMQMSSALALMPQVFAPKQRPFAFAVYGSTVGAGVAFGPMIGGLITQGLGWQWVFLLNAPVGVLLLAMILRFVRESRDSSGQAFDHGGVVTFALFLFLLVLALNTAPAGGWSSARTLGLLAASSCFLFAFIRIERRHPYPMFDLTLFRIPTFVGISTVPFVLSISYWALLIYLPLYFERSLHLDASASGIALLPLTVPLLLMPLIAPTLARRLSVRNHFTVGMVLVAAGALAIGRGLPIGDASLWWGMALSGAGVGLLNGDISRIAVSVVPSNRSGMASGISGTMRQGGFATGIALLGAVLSVAAGIALDRRVPQGARVGGLDAGEAHALALHHLLHAGDVSSGSLPSALAAATDAAFVDGLSIALYFASMVAVTSLVPLRMLLPARDR